MVAHAMSSIASEVDQCAASGAQGTVKLFIRVKPDGSTSSVEIRESPDETLGSCVADAVRGAHFRATLRGGAFTKSFTF
jgi:TonB family protein